MSRKPSVTFAAAFSLYLNHAHLKPKTRREALGLRSRYLKPLESRKLSTITRLEAQAIHSNIGSRAGHTAANRAIELLACVFNRAIDWGLHTGANPAAGVTKFRLKSRDRFLKMDELPPLLAAMDTCKSATVRDFLYLCLYTAARSGNVMQMQWADIDWTESIWFLRDTKNGDSQYVPLHPEVLLILKARHGISPRSPYVFPGAHGGHMVNPRKTWYDILRRAQITDLRIHDLRRTHASLQLRAGVHLRVIGQTLNHRDIRSTLVYARMDYEPVREAMHLAVSAILKAKDFASHPA